MTQLQLYLSKCQGGPEHPQVRLERQMMSRTGYTDSQRQAMLRQQLALRGRPLPTPGPRLNLSKNL